MIPYKKLNPFKLNQVNNVNIFIKFKINLNRINHLPMQYWCNIL